MGTIAIGIDQGTTSTRALALGEDGDARIMGARRHRQIHPRAGWVEHAPLELLDSVRACVEAAGSAPALGLANQGESCLAWHARTGAPLSPVIVWQDARTSEAVARLKAAGAEAETIARAGLPLDPYFSASKLGWLLTHSDEVKQARREGVLRMGTTDAFFLDRLAGRFATDATTASRTSLMNLETGGWDPVLCGLFGIPMEVLPPILDTVADFGAIGATPVAASIVDQQAGLVGHGRRAPGEVKITFGTGAFVLALTGGRIVRERSRGMSPTLAWRLRGTPTYAVEGGVYDVGSAIEWAKTLGLFDDFAELDRFAQPPAIARGLTFVPALSGLACPYWDRTAAPLWIGMTAATSRADLMQALIEGVALLTADVVDAVYGGELLADSISIDGGVSRNDYFCQFLADVLGVGVRRPAFHELTAFGCAVLAAGRFDDPPPAPGAGGRLFEPTSRDGETWRALFARALDRSRTWR